MPAYKIEATIEAARRLVLEDLPFAPGQKVEIVVRTTAETTNANEAWRALFAETQKLPTVRNLTEEEVLAEIAAYYAAQ